MDLSLVPPLRPLARLDAVRSPGDLVVLALLELAARLPEALGLRLAEEPLQVVCG